MRLYARKKISATTLQKELATNNITSANRAVAQIKSSADIELEYDDIIQILQTIGNVTQKPNITWGYGTNPELPNNHY